MLRPLAVVKFRAALDDKGLPVAIEAVSATEGPTEALSGKQGEQIDPTALEGLSGKSYAIPNKRIAQIYVKGAPMLGYWRSVGNSLNDFSTNHSWMSWRTRAATTRMSCACTCCATTRG